MSTDGRPASGPAAGVVVVLSGFPRRSETFALAELAALERAGLLRAAFATKPGDGLPPHPDARRLAGRVTLLPHGEPAAQADAIVRRLKGLPPLAFHGYFAHQPAEVAACAAARLGVPFGFSVHAKDARVVPAARLKARAERARCVVACNTDAQAEIVRLGVTPRLVPHGVNLSRFVPTPLPASLEMLAVGRLVQKKGFHVLLRALAGTSAPWSLRVVGDGPEAPGLRLLAEQLGVAARVTWLGSRSHAELPALYAGARVVAVPSIVDEAGDRDGLPNVVLEAMAAERAVVATRAGAIEAAVVDGETGLLVPPGDASALAVALDTLAAREDLSRRLAARGRRLVEARYDVTVCARHFADTLAAAYV